MTVVPVINSGAGVEPVREEGPEVVEAVLPPPLALEWSRYPSGNYGAASERARYTIMRRVRSAGSDPWWQLTVDGARRGEPVELLRDAKAAAQKIEDGAG